ncbi:gamma subclass chorismate mutase AroQ [Pseudoduganella sp. LjRoot289]|uniref:gamma subclass chorismate mutase AroQ n=1 Tax=Pseudoduganella sp. LjRoot289 TaxID=3342314 RepID=UPI003ECFB915
MQAGQVHDDLQPLRLAIDQRLLLAQAVARAKWNVQAPVEDLQREAQVIQAAVKQGATLGLPDGWVESVFRAQIEASKIVQRELFANWTAQHAGKFDDAPDLARTVRPELDRITTQILRSLANNQAVLTNAARQAEVARAMLPLAAATLSPSAAERALLPFMTPR